MPAPLTPQEVRSKVEELARLSKDLEANVRMQAKAVNMIAAEQLRKRVKELTEQQNTAMAELVSAHPSVEMQRRFSELSSAVDEIGLQIKASKEVDQLKELERGLESTVEEYVHCFQSIVAELMGAPPPAGPVFS